MTCGRRQFLLFFWPCGRHPAPVGLLDLWPSPPNQFPVFFSSCGRHLPSVFSVIVAVATASLRCSRGRRRRQSRLFFCASVCCRPRLAVSGMSPSLQPVVYTLTHPAAIAVAATGYRWAHTECTSRSKIYPLFHSSSSAPATTRAPGRGPNGRCLIKNVGVRREVRRAQESGAGARTPTAEYVSANSPAASLAHFTLTRRKTTRTEVPRPAAVLLRPTEYTSVA